MAESALALASGKVEIFFYLNEDDDCLRDYYALDSLGVVVGIGYDQPTNKSWNEMAKESSGDLLMVCGDDVEFKTAGWDEKLKAAVPEDGYAILSVNDGRGGKDSHPHPIYTRKMFDALGYVMYPAFFHWYGDSWAAELGKRIGRHIWLEDVLVEHQKPSDQGIIDETHARIRRNGWHDRDSAVWKSPATQRALDAEVSYVIGLIKKEYD
jgi:hypothetical protein